MKEILRKILLAICVCVFVYSAYQLFLIYQNYHTIEEESKGLIVEYVKETDKEDPTKRVIDFKNLQKRNKDVIGWLYIPDTKIDEPILKGKNNDSYLRTGIDKKHNSAGQVFVDEINQKDFKDDNTIIYGHNMRNGSRFHDLRYYVKKDFYQEHQHIYIYLPNQTVNIYEVYGASIVNADNKVYRKGIQYQDYIKEVQALCKRKSTVDKKAQPLIMLSTCYDHGSSDRFVVFARLSKNVKTVAN